MSRSRFASMPCEGCRTPIPDRPDRKGRLCRSCQRAQRCGDCGQLLGSGPHSCASVDLKGPRTCLDCNKPLKADGYERWKRRCGRCEKTRYRNKLRRLRRELRAQFGGKCSVCGYDRCDAALHFHHVDASEKYAWARGGRVSLREVQKHPERFALLCANCHIEAHHPALIKVTR